MASPFSNYFQAFMFWHGPEQDLKTKQNKTKISFEKENGYICNFLVA